MIAMPWRAVAITVALAATAAFTASAGAATFTVNRADDPAPALCTSGDCSLREAIIAANSTRAQDTVRLAGGIYQLTIDGDNENAAATGDLDVRRDTKIVGEGPGSTAIRGAWTGDPDRILDVVRPGVEVTAKGVEVADGEVDAESEQGGGIRSKGTLRLTNAEITSNEAAYAAAVDNLGTAVLKRVEITDHSSNDDFGCCSFYNEPPQAEGEPGSVAKFTNVIFANNVVPDDTAAFYGDGDRATLRNVTFDNNTAGEFGGGAAVLPDGESELTNVTFEGNSTDGAGGAVWVGGGGGNPQVLMNNVTMANNTADADGDGPGSFGDGGALFVSDGTVKLQNTLLAQNTDASTAGTVADDCAVAPDDGALVSRGHNLFGDTSGCDFNARGSDLVGTQLNPIDARLGPLSDNGGFTETVPLLTGSPAIDAGSGRDPGSGRTACAARDQRGIKRPDGPRCDIGAYEAQAP